MTMSSLLTPFVPDLLLRAQSQGQSTTHWQTDGSFVFADISGFTRLSEQLAELGKAGAEELTVLLNATFEDLLGVARADGGDLVKFGGDALFLFFTGDRHAERCCRAAAGMRAALKARGAVVTDRGRVLLKISMGVHSGPFLFVVAGDRQRELFVLGEHATMVTDMESAADAGEILVSAATAALLPPSWLGAPKEAGVLLRRVTGSAAGELHPTTADEVEAGLDPFVPRAIRRRIDDDEHAAEHRRTTVSFVHVGGVDALLRDRGPDVVADQLDRIVRLTVDAADRHEVTLLATDVAGGGIKMILTAGVPDSVEDGEGRMLAVGRALIDADVGLPIRVGVNTGHVFAGEVGAPWRRVYTVMGDAVNLSARLMAKARPGEMVASEVTLATSATPFETMRLEPFMVKGKRLPQHASSVGRRVDGRGRDALASAGFVGRAAELHTLIEGLEAAVAGAGSVVEILGEAGIGKSRLVHELIDRAHDQRVVRLTCEPFAVDRPYFMARVLLRTALRIPLDAEAADAGAQLVEWLEVNSPEWLDHAPLLAVAIDADVADTRRVDELGVDFRATRLRHAASAVLHAALRSPLLLVVEDAMWMDEASALVLANALEPIAGSHWFGCFTTRDRTQGLSSRLGFNAATLDLQPLGEQLAQELAASLTDDDGIPHSELVELCARAKGNPLFLLELAHARREVGSLDAIPGSLEDLIGARIDRLAPADRTLLRHAAVLGDRFSPKLFDRTLGASFSSPVRWDHLADFIVTDQGELRFTHDLVRRVAYAGLPFRRRRELHLRIASALVPRGEPDDARLGLLALHFDGSGDHSMAWKYNRLAGDRARANYATVEAAAFYDRAISNARDAAEVGDGELAEVYEALADVALLAGRFDFCQEGLRRARRHQAGDSLAVARLCRKEGKLRERLGKHAASGSWFRRGLAELHTLPSTTEVLAERARLQTEWASTLIATQKRRQSVQRCRAALPDAVASGDRRAQVHLYRVMEWALGEIGDDDAHHYRELALEICEDIGDFVGLGGFLMNAGVDALTSGQWQTGSDNFERARLAYVRAGDMVTGAQAGHNLAELYVEQGRYEDAESLLRDARRVWRASGFAMGVAAVNNCLGRALGRSGRSGEGIELLRDAKERFASMGHPAYAAESAARLAEALLFALDHHGAIDELDAQRSDALDEAGAQVVALALRVRGTALGRLGDRDGAREWLGRCMAYGAKHGIEWEAALASIELARLPGTRADEADLLERNATVVLTSMGVDIERVLPPR
jgi:class 3 adenylate cyclase/tetratricopeptide (TPR) repeat protein